MTALALVLAAQVAAAVPAPPLVERVVDGSGRPVATVVRIDRSEGNARRSLLLVRGVAEEDLVVSAVAEADATPVHRAWIGARGALRFDRLADGRLAASGGARSVRWFEEDGGTRTVRCALSAIAESVDARLAPAAAAWASLKEALGETRWSEAEEPLRLLRVLSPPRPERGATHRRVPLAADDPDSAPLRRAAEAALAQAERAR